MHAHAPQTTTNHATFMSFDATTTTTYTSSPPADARKPPQKLRLPRRPAAMSENRSSHHWSHQGSNGHPYGYSSQPYQETQSYKALRADGYPQQQPPHMPRTSSSGSVDSGRSPSDYQLEREDSNHSGRYHYGSYAGLPDQAYAPSPREALKRTSSEHQHVRHHSRDSFVASESEDGHPASRLPSIKELCCPHCNQVFLETEQLKEHMKSHVEERPYHCPICQHTFSRLHDLERHTMIHTGEKPHVCDECGRRFARAYTMARHKTGGGGCAGKRQAQRGPKSTTPTPSQPPQSPPQERPPAPDMSWFHSGHQNQGPPSSQSPRFGGSPAINSG